MPNIITVEELRQVLGVSDSLYDDPYLEQIIDSAEGVILPLLTQYQSSVVSVRIQDGVLHCTTIRPSMFVVGQGITIEGCGMGIDGGYTVTGHSVSTYIFTALIEDEPDKILTPIIPAGRAYLDGGTAAELYQGVAPIKSALLVVSNEIFQSITAAGGQIEGVDFAPTPFRMGRSLLNRVIGLISPFIDVETIAT
jgi:hypothetical protein